VFLAQTETTISEISERLRLAGGLRIDMHSRSHSHARRIALPAMLMCVSVAGSAQTPAPQDPQPPTSPLAIHVGDADLLIGGFIDATSIRRSTNTGSGLGTSFGTIPFGNTVQGNMKDTQFSSQGSRVSLQATSKYGTANLKAFLELDFLGNAPTGLNVTTNSNTPRMRLYWGQFRKGAFEFVTGQAWSLIRGAGLDHGE
jgi:hypothetical protein